MSTLPARPLPLLLLLLLLWLPACGGGSTSPLTDGDAPEEDGEGSDSDDSDPAGDSDDSNPLVECTPPITECHDDTSVVTCGPDGRWDWSRLTQCNEGYVCDRGACVEENPDGDADDPSEEGEAENPPDGDDEGESDGDAPGEETESDGLSFDGDAPADGDDPGEEDSDPSGEEAEPDDAPDGDAETDGDSDAFGQCNALFDESLLECLRHAIDDHNALGYDYAREVMFSELDNVNGRVQCVYTGVWVETDGIPPSSEMNCEHSWPQSLGAGDEPARSDLHHLFPTDSVANSHRSNRPFNEVETVEWSSGGSMAGEDDMGRNVFEPRDVHKGDAARALFYFAARYDMSIPDFEEETLRVWHEQDPPSDVERRRNDEIETWQENRNPFIDRPDFVERISDF